MLNKFQVGDFQKNGFLLLRGFYDVDREVVPIQRGIHQIIGQVMQRHGLPDHRQPFDQLRFDDGYSNLIAIDRSFGGEVYDAIKQIPAFIRLLSTQRHEEVFSILRDSAIPAIAAAGFGIRIDNPGEDRYRAEWHQEYPSQLRSLDGLVFWSPLRQITPELGPVRLCPGSHLAGLLPVIVDATNGRTGAYSLRLRDENLILGYEVQSPICSPGDAIVIDFLTLHASGFNRSPASRWSMQFRYFNFNEPTGRSHGWKGSYAAGIDFRAIHPELCPD